MIKFTKGQEVFDTLTLCVRKVHHTEGNAVFFDSGEFRPWCRDDGVKYLIPLARVLASTAMYEALKNIMHEKNKRSLFVDGFEYVKVCFVGEELDAAKAALAAAEPKGEA